MKFLPLTSLLICTPVLRDLQHTQERKTKSMHFTHLSYKINNVKEMDFLNLDLTHYTRFSCSIPNKVNSVADLNNDLPHPPPLSHSLPSFWINGPTNKCEGILQPNWRQFFSCHNFYVYPTSIVKDVHHNKDALLILKSNI